MSLSKMHGQIVTKEKSCIACGNKFIVSVLIDGQGSTNVFRRKYCSKSCKKSFRKSNATALSIELECEICHIKYFLPPSLAVMSRTCSTVCRIANLPKVTTRVLQEIRSCKTCQCAFEDAVTGKQQYCSHQCFNVSQRTSISKPCLVCGMPFMEKLSQCNKHRFCSRKCQMIAQSNGMIKIHTNGRCGKRVDLGNDCFRSSFEADYARACRYYDIKCLYQSATFRWKNDQCAYTPDFYHPDFDFYVELKSRPNNGDKYSTMMTKNLGAHNELRSNYNVQIYTLYMNDFYQLLRDGNIYWTLPNLEKRNYRGTKHLILKN